MCDLVMQIVGRSFGHHKRSEYLRAKLGLQLLRGVGVEEGLLFCFDDRCRVLFKGVVQVVLGASETILVHFTDFESLDGKFSRVWNCRCGIYFISAY